jgi:methionyl-tRNA formyltransferase
MMKIVFFGSDDFAQTHLTALHEAGFKMVACVTKPDRPAGRGMKVSASPIKMFAEKHQLPVFQPEKMTDSELIIKLKALSADLFVVIAYGKILPLEILSIPKMLAINVHGSLLPKYRGAAPIHWAVINGESETGVTVMKMNPQLDAGEIISQEKMRIAEEDTVVSVREKMMVLGAKLLVKTLRDMEGNKVKLLKQDEKLVTAAPKLTKDMGEIDWRQPAEKIQNLIRGLLPWPTAYTFYQGKLLKVLSADVIKDKPISSDCGVILEIQKDGIVLSTGKDDILIRQVHPESAKQMDAASFARGHQLKVGSRLGK